VMGRLYNDHLIKTKNILYMITMKVMTDALANRILSNEAHSII